jgi:hypothetical protein
VQGVVAHYEIFGKNNSLAAGQFAIADRGRTVVHEVGHYLGLRHIWGDGPLSIFGIADCTVDDGIADTPNSGTNSQIDGCAATKNTCNDGPGDLPDMWENYMDYSEESCQNIFTQGQIDIMRAMIATARSGLLQPQCLDTTNNDTTSNSIGYNKKHSLHVNVYPNPGIQAIKIQSSKHKIQNLKLYDIAGKIQSDVVEIAVVENERTIDISALPSGIYHIEVNLVNGFSEKLKFIRQ